MRYLLGDQWSDSFLDYYCGPDAYRIRVSAFANLEQLTGIYFVPLRSARLLWNYLREVGVVGVLDGRRDLEETLIRRAMR